MTRIVLVLATLIALTAHAEVPGRFAWRLPLTTAGEHAYYRVDLPASVHEGSVRADLGDLRILNGEGSAVPIALLPPPAPTLGRAPDVPLTLFPLFVDDDHRDVGELSIRLRHDANGTLVDVTTRDGASLAGTRLAGYLIDAGERIEPFTAVTFALASVGSINVRVRIDGSDDLVSWRSLVASAPLLALEYQGKHLVRDRVDLVHGSARYLRVTFPGAPRIPSLTGARGELAERTVETPRQWREAAGTADADHPGDYLFDTGGTFPVDRVTLVLPEINTVAPAQVYVQGVMRDDTSAQDGWRRVSATVFYRLREDGGEVLNPPLAIPISMQRRWKIHVDPQSGGVGGVPPKLSVGWVPLSLVFAARGGGPFTLAFGSSQATPVLLPIAILVPGFDLRSTPAAFGVATPGAPAAPPALEALRVPIDVKRWLLWATLALAAAVLGWMALRLSRQMNEPAPKPREAESSAEV